MTPRLYIVRLMAYLSHLWNLLDYCSITITVIRL